MIENSRRREIKNQTGLVKLEPKHIQVHLNTNNFHL